MSAQRLPVDHHVEPLRARPNPDLDVKATLAHINRQYEHTLRRLGQ
jgi:hypothetical protein